jgi:formylglycine-generating enzyme required for sulfatase activity/Cdc6-like AAA superfamily ATPase
MDEEMIGPKMQGKWSDREIYEIEQDRFSAQDYANVLANRAATADTPLSIGIYGRWGSGKTSLMRLVEKLLSEREKPIESIWINVWQLSSRKELWNAFLQALFTQVHRSLPWMRRWAFDWSLFRERVNWGALVRTLLVNSYRIVIVIIPIIFGGLIGKPDASWADVINTLTNPISSTPVGSLTSLGLALWLLVKPAIEAAKEKVSIDFDVILKKNPYEVQVSELQQLQTQFERLVKTLVGDSGRLVIFIDDLDRCTPDKVPEVLEAIKLFTNMPRCVYLIGLDHEIVRLGIENKYKFGEDAAVEYLEKIIQIPFHLPGLEEYLIGRFVVDDYSDVHHTCPTAPEVFAKGMEPNPRKVKRVLNIYRTLWELSKVREENWEMDPVEPELLAKMVVLQSRFSPLYEHFRREVEDIPLVEQCAILIFGARDDVELDLITSKIGPMKDDLQTLVEKQVLERDRDALNALFASGKQRFYKIQTSSLSSYIYLTGTAEGESELMRPSRQEREALLSNDRPRVRERVAMILARAANEEEQERLTASYVARLLKVVGAPALYSENEIASASYAQSWFQVEGYGGRIEEELLLTWGEELSLEDYHRDYVDGLWDALKYGELNNDVKQGITNFLIALKVPFLPQVVHIPAGTFLMGSTDEQAQQAVADGLSEDWVSREQPQHSVDLSEYRIGKYPVTNIEYQAFVQDTKASPPSHWEGPQYPEGTGDHPVVLVRWSEAIAYCEWLSEATGRPYRLPTEAEWEKAARGEDGRIFPWGNKWEKGKCNTEESGIGSTSAVGQFSPEGDSPYGVVDMAGNVWEWCSSVYQSYPYDADDRREDLEADGPRVLRGGSWYGYHWYARCAYRLRDDPDAGDEGFGFRVVVSPS